MNAHKLASFLAPASIAVGLLLGAGMAWAQDVILDGNDVVRIENLQVFDDQGGPRLYDVEFVYGEAIDLFGADFNNPYFMTEEDGFLALEAVTDALNANTPTPSGAGSRGTDQFFIPIEEEDGFMGAVGAEHFQSAWDQCERDCAVGVAVLRTRDPFTYAVFTPSDGDNSSVNLTGTVENAGGKPLCAMVLASGKYQFSCNPDGPFSLTNLSRENDGTVKRQVYVDGSFPNIEILQGSRDETVVMEAAGKCPEYNQPYNPQESPGSAGKRVNISGMVLVQNTGTPVCAMVLANGQYVFSCDGSGNYKLNIPLDDKGQFKLQVYADGFAPSIMRYDEFSVMNDVRLARAAQCQ
jgi:hypothetical protein